MPICPVCLRPRMPGGWPCHRPRSAPWTDDRTAADSAALILDPTGQDSDHGRHRA